MIQEIVLPDLTGLPETNVPCPKCESRGHEVYLVTYSTGMTLDDFETGLICPNCYHYERD